MVRREGGSRGLLPAPPPPGPFPQGEGEVLAYLPA